jgi:hypothetical protein
MLQSTLTEPSSPPIEQHTSARTGTRTIVTLASAARRFLVISAIAFWLGGFTFYAGVAVPMGVEVLGTHKAVGFVTQRVTHWLNIAGIAALAVLLANLAIGWRQSSWFVRRLLLISLIVMVAIEIELFIMHPTLDRLLVTQPVREILDEDKFDLLHRIYLISSSVQWLFGVVHVWGICLMWGNRKSAGRTVITTSE